MASLQSPLEQQYSMLTDLVRVADDIISQQTEMFFSLSGKQVKNCFSPKTESDPALCPPQQTEHLYSERLKCDNFHHKAGPKLTIMSVLTENI